MSTSRHFIIQSLRRILLLVGLCAALPALAMPLTSDRTDAAISTIGEVDEYTIDAAVGQTILLRVADLDVAGLFPFLELLDPTGTRVDAAQNSTVAEVRHTATLAGTYTVRVRDNSTGNDATGPYALYFVLLPGAIELGELANHSVTQQQIDLGDLDTYALAATAGDALRLRLVDVNASGFFPQIQLYDPAGVLVASGQNSNVADVQYTAAASGTYRVVVVDNSTGDDATGDYDLYFSRMSDGDELGELANHSANSGAIDLGDFDTYTLTAAVGDELRLRVTDVDLGGLFPQIQLFDPTGNLVTSGQNSNVADVSHTAQATGTYRVLLLDNSTGDDASGDYVLYFSRMSDSSELGELANHSVNVENIDLGDFDTYTVTASVGDRLVLRAVDVSTGGLFPQIQLFDPTGALVTSAQNSNVADLQYTALASGTYRVLVLDNSTGDDAAGAYNLYFSRMSDGDELGALANHSVNAQQIELGDVDVYSFTAADGDELRLRMADLDGAGLFPQIQLFDPSGTLVTSGQNSNVAHVAFNANATGTYRVLVLDNSTGDDAVGNYNLYFSRMSDGDEAGELQNDSLNPGIIDLGDLDTFSIPLSAGSVLALRAVDVDVTGFFPQIQLFGPDGALVASGQNATVAEVQFAATTGGVYRVLVLDNSTGDDAGGNYNLYVARIPGANELGVIPSGATRSETIDLGDLDTWTVSAGNGADVNVAITDLSNNGFFPRVEIFDPFGTFVGAAAGADDGFDDCDHHDRRHLHAPGQRRFHRGRRDGRLSARDRRHGWYGPRGHLHRRHQPADRTESRRHGYLGGPFHS